MTNRDPDQAIGVEPANRREAIAAAAIELLALHGAWGLSHRAIDKSLHLPLGSTSYYFRTRQALLEVAENLVFERDMTCMLETTDQSGDIQGTQLIERWTASSMRSTVLARLELMLEASRNPALQAQMLTHRTKFLQRVKLALAARGIAADEAVVLASVAQFEGALLQRLAFGHHQ